MQVEATPTQLMAAMPRRVLMDHSVSSPDHWQTWASRGSCKPQPSFKVMSEKGQEQGRREAGGRGCLARRSHGQR